MYNIKSETADSTLSSHCTSFFLIFAFIITVYSNTFNASWHFDDYLNIVENKYVHLTHLSPSELCTFFLPYQNNLHIRISRPISFLTFALNWYIGKKDVTGYHVVNICIHCITSIFLYLFILQLFKSPALSKKYAGNECNIALLSCILWSIHPIQTQAITYIVQRMASLAAIFYICAMYSYIKGRLHFKKMSRLAYFSASILCMLLAVGSKENAITFPFAIGLIELIFFQDFSTKEGRTKCLRILLAASAITIVLSLLLLYWMIPSPIKSFQARSGQRNFTMFQRAITEPRVIMYYLVQIYYPLLKWFSIEHSINLSTSLFKPITTLFSILSIACILIFSIIKIKRFPTISFAILFYFLNHTVESTFIPLELMFEHRNYLPSFFLFLPISIGIINGISYFRKTHKTAMFFLCASVMVFLLIIIGTTTFIRNGVWASEKTLWEDAIKKVPLSVGAWSSLAFYYSRAGDFDKALELYNISLNMQRNASFFPSATLRDIALIYSLKHDYKNALSYYEKALAEDPSYIQALYEKSALLISLKEWDSAAKTVKKLISKGSLITEANYFMGLICLHTNKAEEALKYLILANQASPLNPKIFTQIGIAMSMMGHYQRADWFLYQAYQLGQEDMAPLLYRINNDICSNSSKNMDNDISLLLKRFPFENIKESLIKLSQDCTWNPISTHVMERFILEKWSTHY